MMFKTKKCKLCGKEFNYSNSVQKYCSYECVLEVEKKKKGTKKKIKVDRSGKNNPNYKHGKRTGYKPYIADKEYLKNLREIKEEMIQRRGYIYCELTGKSGCRLEGHHIIYRSEEPKHPKLHSKENIILVTVKRHNKFHNKKSIRNNLVKERGLDKIFGTQVLIFKNMEEHKEFHEDNIINKQ